MIHLEDLLNKAQDLTGCRFFVTRGVFTGYQYLTQARDIDEEKTVYEILVISQFTDAIVQYLLDLILTEGELTA